MADETSQARIRAAIEEWMGWARHPHGSLLSALTEEEVADLVECIDRALYPNGHEDTPEHWQSNAAEEKRKKQHVSELLAKALREKTALETEVRKVLRLSRRTPTATARQYVVPVGIGIKPFEVPFIAALLQEDDQV